MSADKDTPTKTKNNKPTNSPLRVFGFENELRTVNPELLNCLPNFELSTHIITKMLSIVGVQQLTPHDVINLYIAPVYLIY